MRKIFALDTEMRNLLGRLVVSVAIPGGAFPMGSADLRQPVRTVTLTKPYAIGKYPVVNRLFRLYMEATKQDFSNPDRFGRVFDTAYNDHPVAKVTWHQASAFCEWLNSLGLIHPTTGKVRHFRIPTEAEWERAARGIEGRKYPWGKEAPDETRAVFRKNDTEPVGTHPAGATPEEVHDMAGNVWEWVEDSYVGDGVLPGGADPLAPSMGYNNLRVLRGGAANSWEIDLHGAHRFFDSADYWGGGYGFRYVEDL